MHQIAQNWSSNFKTAALSNIYLQSVSNQSLYVYTRANTQNERSLRDEIAGEES